MHTTSTSRFGSDLSTAMAFRLLLLLIVCGMAAPVHAQTKVGTTAAPFLEVGVGARSVAMGEASAALAQDVSAIYWNPSGIARMQGGEVAFEYTQWFADTQLQYVGAAVPAGGGVVGVHAYVFDSGEMEETTLLEEFGNGRRFDVQSLSVGISYARLLTERFSVGGTLKYVGESVAEMRASTVAIDMGIQYQLPFRGMRLGFAIQNFGSEMQLDGSDTSVRVDLDPNTTGDPDATIGNLRTREWDLPLVFRIGLSYDVVQSANHSLTLVTDANYPNNNDQSVAFGAEYGFSGLFFVRAGMADVFTSEARAENHLRLGAGIQLADRVRADYAWADRGDLGTVNRIGVGLMF